MTPAKKELDGTRTDRPQPVAVACLAAFAAAYVLAQTVLTYRLGVPASDAAEYVQIPARFLSGDIPYRDFLMFYPPGYLALPALLAHVLDGQIAALRLAHGALAALLTGLAVWCWAPGRRALPAAHLALLLVAVGFGDETLVAWAAVLALAALLTRAATTASATTAVGVGLLAGVAGTVRLEQTPFLLAAAMAGLIAASRGVRLCPGALRWCLLAAVASLIPWALCVAWVAAHGALPQMVYHLTDLSQRHVRALSLPPLWLVFFPPKPVPVIVKLAGYLAPWAILLWGAALHASAARRPPHSEPQDRAVYAFWLTFGALLATRQSVRWDLVHVFSACMGLYVASAWMLHRSWQFGGRWRLAAAALAGLVALTPAAMLARGLIGVPRALRAPATYRTVDSPAARGVLAPPAQAEAINAVLRYLREHARPGEPIFVADFGAPAYYVLSGHPNGSRYDSILPGFMNAREEAALVNILRHKQVRFIIGREDWGLDRMASREFSRFAPRLHEFIVSQFHPVVQREDQALWERN